MKITKTILRKIINEEIRGLTEGSFIQSRNSDSGPASPLKSSRRPNLLNRDEILEELDKILDHLKGLVDRPTADAGTDTDKRMASWVNPLESAKNYIEYNHDHTDDD